MTPNQVVAWNLWQERKRRGWNHERMSRRLAEHGVLWEKATYYAAEASRDPDNDKPRRFSADEILAFSLAFDLPVASFLVPPQDAVMVVGTDEDKHPVSNVRLMEAGVARDLADMRDLAERLRALATAIEVFEDARQPEPRAAAMTRAALEDLRSASEVRDAMPEILDRLKAEEGDYSLVDALLEDADDQEDSDVEKGKGA